MYINISGVVSDQHQVHAIKAITNLHTINEGHCAHLLVVNPRFLQRLTHAVAISLLSK